MTQITDVVEWRDALAAIAAATSNEGDMLSLSKEEVSAARARASQAVRALRDVGTDAQRLEIVAALIRDPAIKKADLAYVIFGDERKTWHLRRLLAPSERPCSSCGRPVPTTNGNLDGRLLCDSCDATEHAEREKESRQREARNEAQCQRRRKRFEELRAKCGVNDEEFAELIGLAAWEIDNPNNRGCQ